MSGIQFSILGSGGDSFVTAIVPGYDPLVAGPDHPNHDAIVEALLDESYDANDLADLFDFPKAIDFEFASLSERVTVRDGRVYFDGDEVDNSLTQQIVRFMDEGVTDWIPLVNFMENVAANPSDHSREQLYTWLQRRDFSIDEDGHIVAYKGVARRDDGTYESLHSGPAIVNGEQHTTGCVKQAVGDVVELPRSEVVEDSFAACAYGLHVGTFNYAKGYARDGAFLKVTVNPRDVVSVPTGDSGDKVRVCRYVIQDVIDTENGEVKTAYAAPEPYCRVCDNDQRWHESRGYSPINA